MDLLDPQELDDIPFYKQLTTNHASFFKEAQKRCSIIVIPQSDFGDYILSREIVESHIFCPSPLYKKKHNSWNDQHEIEFDSNNTFRLTSKTKGCGSKSIKVLAKEEVHSSQRTNSYVLIVVDQPINGASYAKRSSLTRIPSYTNKFDLNTASYESAFLYLDSLRQIENAYNDLKQKLFLFNEKYVVLPNRLEDALTKISEFRETFLKKSYMTMQRTTEDRDLEMASEIYITGNIYSKLWPAVNQHFQSKSDILRRNARVKRTNSGAKTLEKDFEMHSTGIKELLRMNDLKSAFEKSKCIHAAFHGTISAKTLRIIDTRNPTVVFNPSSSEPTIIAADQALPAFIDLMCDFILRYEQPQSTALLANEYYIEKFRFVPLQPELSYSFTTYRAAIEYLTS